MMTLVFKMLKETEKLSHQFQIYPIALVQVCASSEYLVTLSDDIKPDDYNSDLSIVTGSCLSWFLFFPRAVSSHQAAQRPHVWVVPWWVMVPSPPTRQHTYQWTYCTIGITCFWFYFFIVCICRDFVSPAAVIMWQYDIIWYKLL